MRWMGEMVQIYHNTDITLTNLVVQMIIQINCKKKTTKLKSQHLRLKSYSLLKDH